MRRFIQAVAMAGMLVPSVALAHNGDEPETGGAGTTASSGDGSGTNATTSQQSSSSTNGPVDRPQAATPAWGSISDRIHGGILILDQSITPETVLADAQQSQIPSYQWWISLRPRFYITRDLSVRVRADLTYEWFQGAADTTHMYEAQWGDLWTDLVYGGFPTLAGIKFSAGLRALWPISLASQMRGTYVALGATVSASRAFDLGSGSDLTLGLSVAGTHGFTSTTAGGLTGGSTYGCSSYGGDTPQTCDSLGGPMNAAFNLLSFFTAGWNTPVHGLSVNLMYLVANAWAYDTTAPAATTNMNGVSAMVMPEPGGDNRLRELEWFLASVDYEVTNYLTMSVGYYCYRPVLDPDGQYGNPFWSPGGNSRIFLSATIPFDGLYNTLAGSSANTAPTTIRRASNNETIQRMREQAIVTGTF